MKKIDVAYGLPDSVSEARLLAALQDVTDNFDEAPMRMHAVLGPPARGVRWFTFACSNIGRGMALSQDHFTESMDLDELIVVVRSVYRDEPQIAQCGQLVLERDRETIHVHGALPGGSRRDGDVDEILLGTLGLEGAIRPFDALAAPTHEVVLRTDQTRMHVSKITTLTGSVLPTRVNPNLRAHGEIVESFEVVPRAVNAADTSALAAHLAKVSETVETAWVQRFDSEFDQYVDELVRVGSEIAPLLVAFLGSAGNKTRTARVAIAGLAKLGVGGDAMIAWAAKPSELPSQAGYAG